nr:extensin-like [Arachis hypogaea]
MRKKVIAKRAPREKIYKQPTKPSTRYQDRTFTPSPSPPTSSPHCDPMARTKNTPRFPALAKPTPPPKATPSKPTSSKPGSSKPSSSKGKRQATEEPVPEPQQPRARVYSAVFVDFACYPPLMTKGRVIAIKSWFLIQLNDAQLIDADNLLMLLILF